MESPKQMLARHEGIRLKPYKDTAGKLTIGIGRNLDDVGISTEEAYLMFDNDYIKAMVALKTRLPWTINLPKDAIGVLINMTFNLGIGRLLEFKKFLSALQSGEYAKAADEMLDSKWATQVKSRAIELSQIIRSLG